MPVPSGPLSLGNIQTEYGGSNPASLSEYYRGASSSSTVPNQTSAGTYGTIPTSGAISMGTFRSKGKFVFNATISTNTTDYNISSAATSAGWDGSETLIASVTINAGVYVYATTTSAYALDTGSSFPGGHYIAITNNGLIVGRGGAGGTGGGSNASSALAAVAGSAGGPALRAQVAVEVTNNGTIGGGGGGGGGGASVWLADGDKSGTTTYSASGGGGGGGRANGTAGVRGTAAGTDIIANNGANGTAGALTTVGAGGAGSTGFGWAGGNGGAGGALGTAGSSGLASTGGTSGGVGAGGGGGAAVVGNANITWVVTGTRLGALT